MQQLESMPTLALVGRPNVGKSTLFNQLTRTREALVANIAGLTRDRIFGEAVLDERRFRVIDTGGLVSQSEAIVEPLMFKQSLQAVWDADLVLFLVDGKAGVVADDLWIAQYLREQNKPLLLVVNKSDGASQAAINEFWSMGLGEPVDIAATHRRGFQALIERINKILPPPPPLVVDQDQAVTDVVDIEALMAQKAIPIAIVGRPNVGKSTLINQLLGEDRVVVCDLPGTTRDTIKIPLSWRDQSFVLMDTAGIRRKGKVTEIIEKFSVIKSLEAIDRALVVILLMDASEGVVDQDLHVMRYAIDAGKSILIVLNKWDSLNEEQKKQLKYQMDRKLDFAEFVPTMHISALNGTGVNLILPRILKIYKSSDLDVSTHRLTQLLEKAVELHQPPAVQGRRIKLRYAHLGGIFPAVLIIHGNQTDHLPESYKRYLGAFFEKALKIQGARLLIRFKTSANPYAEQSNSLTLSQYRKRQRVIQHRKGREK
jgi:GTP-binding protein